MHVPGLFILSSASKSVGTRNKTSVVLYLDGAFIVDCNHGPIGEFAPGPSRSGPCVDVIHCKA